MQHDHGDEQRGDAGQVDPAVVLRPPPLASSGSGSSPCRAMSLFSATPRALLGVSTDGRAVGPVGAQTPGCPSGCSGQRRSWRSDLLAQVAGDPQIGRALHAPLIADLAAHASASWSSECAPAVSTGRTHRTSARRSRPCCCPGPGAAAAGRGPGGSAPPCGPSSHRPARPASPSTAAHTETNAIASGIHAWTTSCSGRPRAPELRRARRGLRRRGRRIDVCSCSGVSSGGWGYRTAVRRQAVRGAAEAAAPQCGQNAATSSWRRQCGQTIGRSPSSPASSSSAPCSSERMYTSRTTSTAACQASTVAGPVPWRASSQLTQVNATWAARAIGIPASSSRRWEAFGGPAPQRRREQPRAAGLHHRHQHGRAQQRKEPRPGAGVQRLVGDDAREVVDRRGGGETEPDRHAEHQPVDRLAELGSPAQEQRRQRLDQLLGDRQQDRAADHGRRGAPSCSGVLEGMSAPAISMLAAPSSDARRRSSGRACAPARSCRPAPRPGRRGRGPAPARRRRASPGTTAPAAVSPTTAASPASSPQRNSCTRWLGRCGSSVESRLGAQDVLAGVRGVRRRAPPGTSPAPRLRCAPQ